MGLVKLSPRVDSHVWMAALHAHRVAAPRLPKEDGWMYTYLTGPVEGWLCSACNKMATKEHLRSKKHKAARNDLIYRRLLEQAEDNINRLSGRWVDLDLPAGSVLVMPWWAAPAGAQAEQAVAPNGAIWVSGPKLNSLGVECRDPAPQRPIACAQQPPDWAQAGSQSAQVPSQAAAQAEQAVAPNGRIPVCVPLNSLGTERADSAPQRPTACDEQPPDRAQASSQSAQVLAQSMLLAQTREETLAQLTLDSINLRAEIRELRIRLAQVEEHDIRELRVISMRAQSSFIEFAATLLNSNSAASASGDVATNDSRFSHLTACRCGAFGLDPGPPRLTEPAPAPIPAFAP